MQHNAWFTPAVWLRHFTPQPVNPQNEGPAHPPTPTITPQKVRDGRASYLVVIFQELVQEVHALGSDQVGVLCIGELVPGAPGVPPHLVLQLGVQLYPILAQIVVQLVSAQNLHALHHALILVQ